MRSKGKCFYGCRDENWKGWWITCNISRLKWMPLEVVEIDARCLVRCGYSQCAMPMMRTRAMWWSLLLRPQKLRFFENICSYWLIDTTYLIRTMARRFESWLWIVNQEISFKSFLLSTKGTWATRNTTLKILKRSTKSTNESSHLIVHLLHWDNE